MQAGAAQNIILVVWGQWADPPSSLRAPNPVLPVPRHSDITLSTSYEWAILIIRSYYAIL